MTRINRIMRIGLIGADITTVVLMEFSYAWFFTIRKSVVSVWNHLHLFAPLAMINRNPS